MKRRAQPMRPGRLRRVLKTPGTGLAALMLVLMIVLSLAAPVYASWCGVDPFASDLAGTTVRHGQRVDLMQPDDNPLHLGLTPVGPDWRPGPYMLGADSQGRDVAARLLYGGRSSLLIAGMAALLSLALATIVALLAGYGGGWCDVVLSRLMDVLWAIPVYLLAISLSVVTVGRSLNLGFVEISANSFCIPIVIIALVYVPYAARPLRARVLSLAQTEFVLAARGTGSSHGRIVTHEIMPNLVPSLLVLAPLVMALCLLAESSLSFLALGVHPPSASWGSIILDGENLLYTRPMVAIAPGVLIATTVLSLNVLGNALQTFFETAGKKTMPEAMPQTTPDTTPDTAPGARNPDQTKPNQTGPNQTGPDRTDLDPPETDQAGTAL